MREPFGSSEGPSNMTDTVGLTWATSVATILPGVSWPRIGLGSEVFYEILLPEMSLFLMTIGL